ncbi:tyrosine-protein phosphatase [Nitrospirillum sp. BR 11163]|uniref:tyrosine-protein phosphatase n=1 Tax=Nitrospirillum sp. BR 11163 TaxID=3104323 RepID=UPI002AFE762A|nr:tyrosine-protein phosphatase [Nitrospirillum sp. BR 11163]MEA1674645.1 tyrosine-protein phosphatase [Nitrospirillum sp. BR 11163]
MLSGVPNFRDAGGYATRHGRAVRKGRLYRSGRPAQATVSDVATLRDLGVATIVDLRWPDERRHHPTGPWAGAFAVVTSDIGGAVDPWPDFLRASDLSAAALEEYIRRFYAEAAFQARHVDLFARYFQALADGPGALLVHCTGGKDRTGLVIALTHHLLGVHRDDILADYLATNTHWPYEVHGAEVAAGLAAIHGAVFPSEAAVRAVMEVRPDFLDGAFRSLTDRHGSVEGYIESVLGVSPDMRERIAARLTG